jgi:hypothetical protein
VTHLSSYIVIDRRLEKWLDGWGDDSSTKGVDGVPLMIKSFKCSECDVSKI